MIDPGKVPTFTGNLAAIEAAGGKLSSLGTTITGRGADVHSTFQGLSGSYHAPEAQELFASTRPVQTQAATFGGNVSSVGAALTQFAHDAQPIVQRLATLKVEAQQFADSVRGDDDWTDDGDKVDRNNQLLHDVNAAYVQFLAVEAAAANKIQSLYGGRLFHGGTPSKNDPYAYMTSIPDNMQTPWGTREKESHWWDKAIHWVDHHLPGWAQPMFDTWASFEKGFWIDGVWGTVKGLGLLAIDGFLWQTGTHDLAKSFAPGLVDQADGAAKGLAYLAADAAIWATPGLGATLTTAAATGKLPGPVKDFVDKSNQTGVQFLKGLVAWDEWGKDPARASGAVTFNVLSFLVPGPKGVGAMLKGTAEAGDLGLRGVAEAGDVGARGAGDVADLSALATEDLGKGGAGIDDAASAAAHADAPTTAELANSVFGTHDVDVALSGADDLERSAGGLDDLARTDTPAGTDHPTVTDPPVGTDHPVATDPAPVEHPPATDPAPTAGHPPATDPAPAAGHPGGTDPVAPTGGHPTGTDAAPGGGHPGGTDPGAPGGGHPGDTGPGALAGDHPGGTTDPAAIGDHGNKGWQYAGVQADAKFGDGAVKGQIGNDLSKAAAEMRGGDVIGKEVILRDPGTKGAGFAKADHVVLNSDGTINMVEVKTGDSVLSPAQETQYPRVPGGGVEIGTKQLRPYGIEKGHVLEPGEIPEVRLERWDVDAMPNELRQTLAGHSIDDVLAGHAGDAARHDLLDWMRRDGSIKVEKVWRYDNGQVVFGDAGTGAGRDLLDSAQRHVTSGFDRPEGPAAGADPAPSPTPPSGPGTDAALPAAHGADPAVPHGSGPGGAAPHGTDPAHGPVGGAEAHPAAFTDSGSGPAAGAGAGGAGSGGGADAGALSLGDTGGPPHWEQPPNVDGDYRLGPEEINTDRVAALTKDWEHARYGQLSTSEFLRRWTDPDTGGWRWDQVPDDGFAVHEVDGQVVADRYEVELQPGTQIDRFGEAHGQFLSPDATPYEQRALPPSNLVPRPGTPAAVTDAHPFNYYRYEVVKPFKVDAGGIAPAFEQPGGGIQFLLDSRHLGDVPGVPERLDVAWLVENGYLRPLQSW